MTWKYPIARKIGYILGRMFYSFDGGVDEAQEADSVTVIYSPLWKSNNGR